MEEGPHTPIVFQDWLLQPGADVTLPLEASLNAMLYPFEGEARLGEDALHVREGQLA